MPKLIRLYITQCLIGFGISALFTAGLVYFDVMGLQRLVLGSSDGLLGAFLIFFSNGIVFAGVQFAISIMRMAEKDDGPKGGTRLPILAQPVRVEATAKSRR
ncbi:hypothetical protein PSM7751_00008 [Pseudooceanicola marinus]|uniref:Uncharacterized protein n=1 Tax=Pseudooceanicola marinus TaxID=396013 RepID=A0A1X6Y3U2_9RHOB|nr:hypothetical protein [Pseudooceanicola marinus]PJE33445.1 hypothetical protein CVM50_04250 [Pseudooceanicola marinus]SLN09784.1 hypothetical protein PSM7751_00008 [Pseudooceanicola marinus]